MIKLGSYFSSCVFWARTIIILDCLCSVNNFPYLGCTEGDVRLLEGTTHLEGRVSVCKNNVWGTVVGKILMLLWSVDNLDYLWLVYLSC